MEVTNLRGDRRRRRRYQIKTLVKEAYDKDPLAQKCLSTDADTKVSKSQFLALEFMRAKLQEEKHNVDIGMPVVPSSFGLCFLRNLRKKPVAVAYVDTKVLTDDKDDVVLRDVSIGEWPKAYVTPQGERSS
ncbi:hypothetical protein C5167_047459 [Papaver somniferum]|uniref:Uncharacterized protein n=1 Tax=Papaver somniferum TaxID=3469 RepID=A0A4Y7LJ10_PAPSO|nr:hypothetical protein C5167_047459 [Papaver somniferum]